VECKTKVLPVIIGATETMSTFRKYLSNKPGRYKINEVQETATLSIAHTLKKLLL